MEKLVSKGKKQIKAILEETINQAVKELGLAKAKKKTDKLITKSAKKIAAVLADQIKKETKQAEVKSKKEAKKASKKVQKPIKLKKLKEPELETA